MATETLPGEQIEELRAIAGEHLFMHAQQTTTWRDAGLKIFTKGEGSWVTDIDGNRLLDAMGGLWYKAAGYGRKEIADAMYEQLMAIESAPAPGACISTVQLSGKVADLYHDKRARVFFVSGGSEAVETAVKMAKKYQQLTGKGMAFKVISRRYSYHGGTAMAVSLGRSPAADPMGPEMPGAVHVPNYYQYKKTHSEDPIENAVRSANEFELAIVHNGPDTVAAMIAEPVSAATGVQVPPKEYWQRLREIADKYDVVLIADEVITGFGRIGGWFGTDVMGVKPDITTVAKALTSGYAPLGAAIATAKIADAFIGDDSRTFKHLITFGGHPVAAAAGIKNLEIMEREDLPGASATMGKYLLERLETLYSHPIVGDVRGIGLLAAVELVSDRDTKAALPVSAALATKIPKKLYDKKIVSFRAGDVIAICPPLIITRDEVDFLVGALDETIGEVEAEMGV
ncbi:MAG: aspartate aminotransferase family protein [Chloroflexi bacterium]|nr:aspartate aminotransferase family protein [Chloroflexota bacterium]